MISRTTKSRYPRKRQDLLDAGREYGLTCGLSSLSLDRITQDAHVTKRTLYKYFNTREDFLVAIIQHDGDRWREWFFDAIRERADASLKRLLAFFEILSDWASTPTFNGCLFAQVLSNPLTFSEPIRQAAKQQLAFVRHFLQTHAQKAGINNATRFVDTVLLPIMLLLSGGGNQVCDMPGLRLMETANLLLQDNLRLDKL